MEAETLAKLMVISLVILGTAFHEMGHAFVAYWCGDPTPGRHGRLTFNPIPHLDPPLTAIVLPAMFYMFGGGLFCLATTPIEPARMRRPLRDHALTALAGPAMIFLFMGFMIGLLWLVPGLWSWDEYGHPSWGVVVLHEAALWNLILGCFNLLPLPPLDGYRICRPLMPLGMRRAADDLARSGMIAFVIVIVVGGFLFRQFQDPLIQFYKLLLPPFP